MRKILILLFLTQILSAQNYWEVMKSATLHEDANNSFFIDLNTGWLVGGQGVIYKTENGGALWIVQRDTSYMQPDLTDVYFFDADHGWVCGEEGTVLYTTNGGTDWLESNNVPVTTELDAINFVSNSIGYACGDDGIVIKTTDGGNNWILNTTPATKDLSDIEFWDANRGVAISNSTTNHVLYTETGGVIWNYTVLPMPPSAISAKMYGCTAVRGSAHGWIVGYHGNVFKTTNRGQSWNHVVSLYGSNFRIGYDIDFADKEHGYVAAHSGDVYRTSDGGLNWDHIPAGTGQSLENITALDSNNVIFSGKYGQVRATTDAGTTWTPFVEWPRVSFRGIGIADTFKINAVSFGGDFTHSIDGGFNFTFPGTEMIETTSNLYAIEFIDEQTGFMGADDGKISKTTDGGVTWTMKTNSASDPKQVKCFFSYDEYNIWAGARSGQIYKSVDIGENWFDLYDLGSGTVQDIHFLTNLKGFAVSSGGSIYITNDGGSNWAWHDSVGHKDIYALDFIDGQIGYCVGFFGLVGKTTDGGENWSKCDTLGWDPADSTSTDTWRLYDIEFVDDQEGWIVSSYPGAVFHTTDGGLTWQQYEYTREDNLHTVSFLWPFYGWIAGDNGLLMKYQSPNNIETPRAHVTTRDFHLKQNYPNPFNPETTIEYHINISGLVELSIFDLHGRKIKTIINTHQKPGSYRYLWDGLNANGIPVSSGSYFYKLKINNREHINKMVLLK